MMMYYRNIFKIFIKEEKKILGRWNIDYKKTNLDYKVYLANYDHCGPCGNINLPNIKKNINNNYR